MRFLEQAAYEDAAKLEIEPRPEVVTRVFMLFKGMDEGKEGWSEAVERAERVDWSEVVGVREEAREEERFGVLEWGGMEVLVD